MPRAQKTSTSPKKRSSKTARLAEKKAENSCAQTVSSAQKSVDFISFLSSLDREKIQGSLRYVWESWAVIVGEELAQFAIPLGHEKKALWIGCTDSSEAQEIYMRQREILENVNAFLGRPFFTKLFVDQTQGKTGLHTLAKSVQELPPPPPHEPLSGEFLASMDPHSPVARAYARFVEKHRKSQEDDL